MKHFLLCATCLAMTFAITPARSHAQSAAGTKVVVIDINSIFKNHQRFKGTMDDIKKEIAEFENYLRDQRTAITQQTERLKSLPQGTPEYQQLEEQIAQKHTNLQLETGRKRKEILENEAKVYYNAYKEIEEHVENFARQNGIALVLRFSSEDMDPTKRDSVLQGVNRAVVFQDRLNITSLIIDSLNRRTPATATRQPYVPGRAPVSR